MARSRRGANWTLITLSVVVVVVIGWLVWWSSTGREESQVPAAADASQTLPGPFQGGDSEPDSPAGAAEATAPISWLEPSLGSEAEPGEPEAPPDSEPPGEPVASEPVDPRIAELQQLLDQGREAVKRSDWLAARRALCAAYGQGLPAQQEQEVREGLLAVAEKTIWSREPLAGDPLVGWYKVEKGDNLTRIADKFRVTPQLLARINGLKNPNCIRAGQKLKVVHGPFHARVERKSFRLSAYLDDNVLVSVFPVGLGSEGSTSIGTWKVKDKLINPTYHPPRGGRIIPADDPNNPLSEWWIGLEGMTGDAVGQKGFGLHGTTDADSIGKNVSMGCIRLLDKDMELLFAMLTEPYSTVEVID